MNLQEIEERVAQLDLAEGPELIHSLLTAYGFPKAALSRLKNGTYNRSSAPGETLWRNRVMDRYAEGDGIDLHALIDDVASDERVLSEHPRFVIVRDAARLLALDTNTRDTLDISIAEIRANAAFFLPWAGIEKQQLENLHYADVKAAERMARLYMEIVKANTVETKEDIDQLNVFFARLLFCFFAEDTDVFPIGAFTGAIASSRKPRARTRPRFSTPCSLYSTPPRPSGWVCPHISGRSATSTASSSRGRRQRRGSRRQPGASCSTRAR